MSDAGKGARARRPQESGHVRRPRDSANADDVPGVARRAAESTLDTVNIQSRDDAESGPSKLASSVAVRQPESGRGVSRNRSTGSSFGTTKIGTLGRTEIMGTNYFSVLKNNDLDIELFQYHVDFDPEIKHQGICKDLIRVHRELFKKYVFHGNLLFTTIPLPQPLELTSKRPMSDDIVKLVIKSAGKMTSFDKTYNSFLNIILRRCLGMLNMALIKRNFYDPASARNVNGFDNLTIWTGYFTSIRYHEKNCLLGVDLIFKLQRKDTALQVMTKILGQHGSADIHNRIKAELVGKIVMTNYNNKTYRIDDIDFEKNPRLYTFYYRKEDREISLNEYYHKIYNKTITNSTQFLLVTRPSRRDINRGDDRLIYLIPEFCIMTGLADDHRKSDGLLRETAKITRKNPKIRVEELRKFRRRLDSTPQIQRELDCWGLKFSETLIGCDARVLETKQIMVSGQSFPVRDGNWSRDLYNKRMCVSVELKSWIVLYPKKMNSAVRSFVGQIRSTGGKQNFSPDLPEYVELGADRASDYVEALNDKLSKRNYDFVMCVMENTRTETYNSIKRVTLCQQGIPSQVITNKVLIGDEGKIKSCATKVMMQIACKLGAEPWRVYLPEVAKDWMIIGYDTYHDANQRRAVGAFVASINQNCTRYNSSVKIHSSNEEISPSFRDHMMASLRAYRNNNKSLPKQIIVYRDGVGEGDIESVKEMEVNCLMEACAETAKTFKMESNPHVAYVIVSKRINTRFFSGKKTDPQNPPCGTVVDNTVTINDRFDFFLVSQKVNQGTVSPTSYNVIHNTGNISADNHQKIAYALTQLYYNWAGTLSVPAPVQYAKKLAYLVGENLGDNCPKDNLAKFPYYL